MRKLTNSEYRAVELLHKNLSVKEISEQLNIKPITAANYIFKARVKTNCKTTRALLIKFTKGEVL
jgi:DNA-binding CsgD family transcriptional regulator